MSVKIILHKFDPATRIFSGNAYRLGGLEAITVTEQTLKEHCSDIDPTALTNDLYMGRPRTLRGFKEEWIEVEAPQRVGDQPEGYGEVW